MALSEQEAMLMHAGTGEAHQQIQSSQLLPSPTMKRPIQSVRNYGSTSLPKAIIIKFFEHYQRDHVELE